MLAWLIEHAASFHTNHAVLSYYIGAVALTTLIFTLLQHHFRPIGTKRGRNGQQPHLPPGPRGIPIMGSLGNMKDVRRDPDHKIVSDTPNFYHSFYV